MTLTPPRSVADSEETVSIEDDEQSHYDDMYEMLMQDLMDFMPLLALTSRRQLISFLVAKGHTGLQLYQRPPLGPRTSPIAVVGSRANSNGEITPGTATGNSPLR